MRHLRLVALCLVASVASGQSLYDRLALYAATNGVVISALPDATTNVVRVSMDVGGNEVLSVWDVPSLATPSLADLPSVESTVAWLARKRLDDLATQQSTSIPLFTNFPVVSPSRPMFFDLVEPTNFIIRWNLRPDGWAEQITPHDKTGNAIRRSYNILTGVEIIEPSNPFSAVTGTPSNIRALLDQVKDSKQVKTNKFSKGVK